MDTFAYRDRWLRALMPAACVHPEDAGAEVMYADIEMSYDYKLDSGQRGSTCMDGQSTSEEWSYLLGLLVAICWQQVAKANISSVKSCIYYPRISRV